MTPTGLDAWLAMVCFLGLPSHAFILLIGREWGKVSLRRNLDRLEAELMSAEGFPPPGPPTTDSQHRRV